MKKNLLYITIVISIFINILTFQNGHPWGDDFANYILQSQAIKSRNYATFEEHINKTEYLFYGPWGFPLLISPVISYFPSNVKIIKGFIYIFFVGTFPLIMLLFKKHKVNALITVTIIACSPLFWSFKNNIISDIPNMFFTYLALVLIQYSTIDNKKIINPITSNLIIGLFLFISFIFRAQSLVLIPFLFLVQIIKLKSEFFKWSQFLINLSPYLLFIILYYLYNLLLPQNTISTYLKVYSFNLIGTVYYNSFYYTEVWKEWFVFPYIYRLSGIFTGIAFVFLITGIATNFKDNNSLLIFSILNILLLLITPFQQGIRYLFVIIPIFIYFTVNGFELYMYKLFNRYKSSVFQSSVILYIGISLISIIFYSHTYINKQIDDGPFENNSQDVFTYITNYTNPNDIIGFYKPRALLLFCDRNSVNPRTIKQFYDKEVRYFIYYKNYTHEEISLNILIDNSKIFSQIYENQRFLIFKVNFELIPYL